MNAGNRHRPGPPRRLGGLVAALVVASIALAPVRVVAGDAEAGTEGVGKLFAFSSCAVSIVFASTPSSVIGSALGCLRVLYEELAEDNENLP